MEKKIAKYLQHTAVLLPAGDSALGQKDKAEEYEAKAAAIQKKRNE